MLHRSEESNGIIVEEMIPESRELERAGIVEVEECEDPFGDPLMIVESKGLERHAAALKQGI